MSIRSSRQPGAGRKFTIELSTGGLVAVCVMVVLGLVWVFVLGVLLGRGYKPEAAMPEIARMMPSQMQAAAPAPQPAQPAPAEQEAQSQQPAPAPAQGAPAPAQGQQDGHQQADSSQPQGKVLNPEDLEFMDTLRKKPARSGQPAPEKAAPKPGAAPLPATQTAQTPQPAAAQPAPAPASAQKTQSADPRFEFVYQVGSVKDTAAANSEKARFAALGLESSVETAQVKGETWYRLLVAVRGSEADNTRALETLAANGVKKPLLRSRKPL